MKNIFIIIIISAWSFSANAFELPSSVYYPKDSTEKKKKNFGTDHLFTIDLGINNYHKDGSFPDENNEINSVRPWGSWYVGLTSLHRTHIAGGLLLEWGGGVSWYNFKFENESTQMIEGAEQVEFTDEIMPDLNYEKSKLTISHVNLYLVPVFQFGKKKYGNDGKHWSGRHKYDDLGFRIGAGGYVGHRLGSHTKVKYEDENGDTKKSKEHDNFYLQNIRYGMRLQLGYRGTDIFVNYDMNELFAENRGPDLSAVSFGISF